MSNQQSTLESLRTTAAEATHTVAETIDPSPEKEASGWRTKNSLKEERAQNGGEKATYKEQLHEAARGGPDGLKNKESVVSKGVQSLASYVPSSNKLTVLLNANYNLAISYIPGGPALEKAIYGTSDADINAAQGNVQDDGIPPTRPQNDTQVEEFLRGQYKSKKGDAPEFGEDNGMTGA